ncbi:beta-lactamase family protein [Paenibacillus sp. GSMTC-2017]|uniref:serine hydrolase domain-containing protein n=1 Tax=Paenibacillus sp. GSMTC-2017 TaxID=2794350 RepID=UPI0018D8E7D2|nr:serine hydrolase domain-containing protein [Paenibacillus sp. GSMTC-2017]MBH5319073.1 beta-lactamase family protein [Paenibacillus sp. GSMTC-2017]
MTSSTSDIKKKTAIILTAAVTASTLLVSVQGAVNAQEGSIAKQQVVSQQAIVEERANVKLAMDQAAAHKLTPGIFAVGIKNGERWSYASGQASIYDSNPIKSTYNFRIGSITKSFTATVILQLVDENKLSLEDTVEKWLPGVVQGNGYDGNKITIRHLLQMRSGIANYVSEDFIKEFEKTPFRTYSAKELIGVGLSKKPSFASGEAGKWEYSNTNTVLAGEIIRKVTGETYAQQVKKRIIEPLGMKDTYSPGNASHIPGLHARGYTIPLGSKENKLVDFTEINPSFSNAAGDMISTGHDLNIFFSALLGGKLLKPTTLEQMLDGVESPIGLYGLGMMGTVLSNGKTYWGHGGDIQGSSSFAGGLIGGEHVMAVNINALHLDTFDQRLNVIKAEFSQ